MDFFKISPDTKAAFPFLKHCDIEDAEFYSLVSKHALRVLGVVSSIIKEVTYVF